jgi:hypothetical protein
MTSPARPSSQKSSAAASASGVLGNKEIEPSQSQQGQGKKKKKLKIKKRARMMGGEGALHRAALLHKFARAACKVAATSRLTRSSGGIGAASEDDSTSESSSSEDEAGAMDMKTLSAGGDLPQDFWQIQKLVRYLKIGNQTATILSLCIMSDFDLSKEYCQIAILDAGGLEVGKR